MMDIYIIKTSVTDKKTEELLKNFQKKEILNEHFQRIHSYAYLMLDRILENVYQIKDREIIYKDKKPYLKSNEKQFSISHSGKYIALAISDYNCGIDVEEIKDRNYEKIARRMNFEVSTKEDFYIKWTEYEAQYKLKNDVKSKKCLKFDNYVLTALSTAEEDFEIYFQNNGELY